MTPKQKPMIKGRIQYANPEELTDFTSFDIVRFINMMPSNEKSAFLYNARKECVAKWEENESCKMTKKKAQMYEFGFVDAIDWILRKGLM